MTRDRIRGVLAAVAAVAFCVLVGYLAAEYLLATP